MKVHLCSDIHWKLVPETELDSSSLQITKFD